MEAALPQLPNDFVSMLAHDLLGPIANVIGFAELLDQELERGGVDPRRHLRRLLANAHHLKSVLEGTLMSTRAPARAAAPAPIDLPQLLLTTADRNAYVAGQNGIAVFLETDPDAVLVSDRVRLERVLDNMVSNALKYAPRGSRVTVAAKRDGSRVRLAVTDEGPGLPGGPRSGQLLSLSLRPLQARASGMGHGLGLEIVRRLARQLGGTAGVESLPGRGATFWVQLPGAA